jgi:hypothetical protein
LKGFLIIRPPIRGKMREAYFAPQGVVIMETLLIIVVVVLLLGGGGWYGRGRWY